MLKIKGGKFHGSPCLPNCDYIIKASCDFKKHVQRKHRIELRKIDERSENLNNVDQLQLNNQPMNQVESESLNNVDQSQLNNQPMNQVENENEMEIVESEIMLLSDSDISETEDDHSIELNTEDEFGIDDHEFTCIQQSKDESRYFSDLYFGDFKEKEIPMLLRVFDKILEKRFTLNIPFNYLSELAIDFINFNYDLEICNDEDKLLEKIKVFAKSRHIQDYYVSSRGLTYAESLAKLENYELYHGPISFNHENKIKGTAVQKLELIARLHTIVEFDGQSDGYRLLNALRLLCSLAFSQSLTIDDLDIIHGLAKDLIEMTHSQQGVDFANMMFDEVLKVKKTMYVASSFCDYIYCKPITGDSNPAFSKDDRNKCLNDRILNFVGNPKLHRELLFKFGTYIQEIEIMINGECAGYRVSLKKLSSMILRNSTIVESILCELKQKSTLLPIENFEIYHSDLTCCKERFNRLSDVCHDLAEGVIPRLLSIILQHGIKLNANEVIEKINNFKFNNGSLRGKVVFKQTTNGPEILVYGKAIQKIELFSKIQEIFSSDVDIGSEAFKLYQILHDIT
ncbi:hypothetical protein RDWZM_001294 [Blomia tropicalis]|uniref:Uncharacterized protein n=1 Tax=Blomia tropicalis TaxID=40697 RepID=A0A9Q0MBQ4_BLOTA|nr:hypothetical protein RDWZM_001294 [Blomia tropicalis]